MKIATAAWLAGATMTLTSLTVWSLTPASRYQAGRDAAAWTAGPEAETEASTDAAPRAPVEHWRFEAGSTLKVTGRLGHQALAAGRDSESFVFLDVQAARDAAAAPAPLNLAIVVDRSGSMRGKRLDNAIAAAKGSIARMRDGDVVSVVSFDSRVTEVVPPTRIDGDNRQRLSARIDSIVPGGETCISCGIDRAMNLLREQTGMVNRVLLLSDGDATEGVSDVEGLRRLAGRVRDMGCNVSTVGVDIQYNERVLSAIAFEANGRHYFVANPSDLPRVFDAELESLARTVAKDADMRLTLAPGVELLQVFDRAFRREGNDIVVPMGAFSAGEDKTLLVKVRVPRGAEGERPIAAVRLGFDDLVTRARGSADGELALALTSDPARVAALDPVVASRLGRSTTAATLSRANGLFNNGQPDDARRALDGARTDLRKQHAEASAAAPPGMRGQIDDDFQRQLSALDEAEEGFSPTTRQGAPAPTTAAPTQVRSNEANAFNMRL